MTTAVRPMPSEVRHLTDALELREVATDGRYLEARACRFNTPVDVGPFVETHDPGVFDVTLSRHKDNIPLVLGHDDSVPGVARSVSWSKSDSDLVGLFKFGTHAEAQRAVGLIEERMLTQVSVAFLPGRKEGDSVWTLVDGTPHVRRNHARLIHLGLVTAPADAEAEILAVRSLGVPEDLALATPRLNSARELLTKLRANRVEIG
jgi:HK97 family phage prohead protease